jgi:hypothetical protein
VGDLPVQWSINGIVVAMAPLSVAVANDSLWLVGLLVSPWWRCTGARSPPSSATT